MRVVDFVREELIVPELRGREKSAVLAELASSLAERVPGIECDPLVKALLERERLASTAIGEGVAIPHCIVPGIDRLIACVGRARDGIDCESMDGRPTHIFFMLVAPQQYTGAHLKALARISRLFKDPEFRTRLMQAKDAGGICRVIADEDAKL